MPGGAKKKSNAKAAAPAAAAPSAAAPSDAKGAKAAAAGGSKAKSTAAGAGGAGGGKDFDAVAHAAAAAISAASRAAGGPDVTVDEPWPVEAWFAALHNEQSREFLLVTVLYGVSSLPHSGPQTAPYEERILKAFHSVSAPAAAAAAAPAAAAAADVKSADAKAAPANARERAQRWVARLVAVLSKNGDDLYPGTDTTIKAAVLEGLARLQAVEPHPRAGQSTCIGEAIASTPALLEAVLGLLQQPAISGVKVLIHAIEFVGVVISVGCRDCQQREEALEAGNAAAGKAPLSAAEKLLDALMSGGVLNALVDVIAFGNDALDARKGGGRTTAGDLMAPHVGALYMMATMALATVANASKYVQALADSRVLLAARALACLSDGNMYSDVTLHCLRVFAALAQEDALRPRLREVLHDRAAHWVPILAYATHPDRHMAMAAQTVLFAAPFAKVVKSGSGAKATFSLDVDDSWRSRADEKHQSVVATNAKRVYGSQSQAFNPAPIENFFGASAPAPGAAAPAAAAADAKTAAPAAAAAGAAASGAAVKRCGAPECGKTETADVPAFAVCAQCRAVWYCSRDCQRSHWKDPVFSHKKACKPAAAPAEAAAAMPLRTVRDRPSGVSIEEVDA